LAIRVEYHARLGRKFVLLSIDIWIRIMTTEIASKAITEAIGKKYRPIYRRVRTCNRAFIICALSGKNSCLIEE
jgi:hypothetical protein